MAEISNESGGENRSLKKPLKRSTAVRVDMTPMVDLGFLLIAFFMLTVVMKEDSGLEHLVPDDPHPPVEISECRTMNILIDSSERIFVYNGLNAEVARLQLTSLDRTNGIRQVMMNRSKEVATECPVWKNGKKKDLVCMIKFLPGAKYKSMVDIFDEMAITKTQYGIQEVSDDEIRKVEEQVNLLANN